ncbi:MAG: hypothetical protein JF595_04040 [Sphingomonadales bacterium]|nr:hypothetical protein [Sphingomonadales bacterium]
MSASLTLLPALALMLQAAGAAERAPAADEPVAAASAEAAPPETAPPETPPPEAGSSEPAAPADDRPVMLPPGEDPAPGGVDSGVIDGRRRPGYNEKLPEQAVQNNAGAVRAPPPEAFPTDQLPVPDRWRILTGLCPKDGDQALYTQFHAMRDVCHSRLDPYHQNMFKGDIPLAEGKRPGFLKGDDWFLNLGLVSDSVLEPRTFPIPVGVQTTARPQSLDIFGKDSSFVFSQTVIASASLIKGQTAYKPPEIEYRVALAFNYNYVRVPERRVLFVEPSKPTHRSDDFLGVQEAFIDYHIRNVSDRYDFDSVRVGIQPFQADFRGFLFNDNQLGIRFFGNRDNNRFQYNLAAFWRVEKDTNSGLNNLTQKPRDDFVFIANVYRQDFLIPALTSQITVVYNRNREGRDIHIDDNGFPVRPALLGDLRGRNYDVLYVGYNADGRVGRLNITASAYGAFGEDHNSFFTSKAADIRAYFAAAELSYDHDWMRFRVSGLFATGDHDPYDNKETGFDAIFENPIFAGADTSYWIRQSIPFAGGGRVISINGRNGILNSLRSSKEEGQSNFNNPGTILAGAGADFDLTPQIRLSGNANHLWFENTSSLQALRNEGSIPKAIGWDLSAAAIWRPHANQNIVLRLSAAALLPGGGFRDLFDNLNGHRNYYSVLANVIVAY